MRAPLPIRTHLSGTPREDSRRAGSAAGEGPGGQGVDGESTGADQDSADGQDSTAGQDFAIGEDTGTGVGAGAGQGSDDALDSDAGREGAAGEDGTAGQNSDAGEDPAAERIYDLRASNPDSQAEFFDLMDTLEQAKARQDMAGGEIAAALVLSPKSGNIYVQRALALVRELPDTLELLREGVLDQTRASMIHKYACKLNDLALWCEFERRALKIAPRLAPAKLEYLLKRIVTDLEPEDAAEAEKRAFNRRCTGRYDLDGAMARFYADLTAENAQLVQQLVDQIARTMGNAGGRTLEQCRADAFAAIFEQLHTHGTIDLREILAAAAHVAAGGDMPDDDEYEDVVDEGIADDLAEEVVTDEEPDGRLGDAIVHEGNREDEPHTEETDSDSSEVGDNADEATGVGPDGRRADAVVDEVGETTDNNSDTASESAANAEYQADCGGPFGTASAEADADGTDADTDPAAADSPDESATLDMTDDSAGTDATGDAHEAGDRGVMGDSSDTTGAADGPVDVDVDVDCREADNDNAETADDNTVIVGDNADTGGDDDTADGGVGGDSAEDTDSQPADVDTEADPEPESRCDSQHPVAPEATGCSESEPPDGDPAGHSEPEESLGDADPGDPPPFDPFRFDDPDTPRPPAPKWRAPVWQDRAVNPALPWNGVITISLEALAGLADHPGDMSGFGCISPDLARQLLKAANSVTLLVIDPDTGAPVGVSDRVYVPPGSLRRKVMLLTQTCSWVGCNRKAERCDVDHGEPFDHNNPAAGGKTTLRNLRPLCRFHHRLKTFTAWTITEHADRSATLVSALGRTTRRPPPAITDPGEWEPAWQTEDHDDDTPPF
ncbi:DUF222 domain-containing protein [Nakamurella sp. YIM 132087]|uniref:DUF222 domain-containing protein n=1 Tax=Nakamurella alba TaxID=2665158 RepID=A0A7K1FS49_9ACTN|nr:HNH endonuclease signature motif containing protein [Nakamurella alba]MTD16965.1 DUF222 domain-containing protein [Nakamurella alba]